MREKLGAGLEAYLAAALEQRRLAWCVLCSLSAPATVAASQHHMGNVSTANAWEFFND